MTKTTLPATLYTQCRMYVLDFFFFFRQMNERIEGKDFRQIYEKLNPTDLVRSLSIAIKNETTEENSFRATIFNM